jgi:hypothetical protein
LSCPCCWLLLISCWYFGFKICFDKCHFHRMMMILAFEKVFCCCLCCWTMWGSVCSLFFVCIVWGFFDGVALVFSKFSRGWWLGYGWMVSFVI